MQVHFHLGAVYFMLVSLYQGFNSICDSVKSADLSYKSLCILLVVLV